MKRVLMAATTSAVLAYGILMLVMGPAGLLAHEELELQTRLMEENVRFLSRLADRYGAAANGLVSDPEAIAIAARELDYLADGEKKIVIEGRVVPGEPAPFAAIVTIREKSPLDAVSCASLAAGIAIMVSIVAGTIAVERSFARRTLYKRGDSY